MKITSRTKFPIANSAIGLTILILPYFMPSTLDSISPVIAQIFDYWRLASFIVVLTAYLLNGKISKIISVIAIYEAALFVSTFINGGDYWQVAVKCGNIIGFCTLTELCVKKNSKKYFSCVFWIYFVLLSINLVVMMICPGGIGRTDKNYTYNFLGIDNSFATLSIPLMAVACIYSAYRKKKIVASAFLVLFIISTTVLITWSATGVVVWFIELSYILFIYKGRLTKYLHSVNLFLTYVVAQVGLVFMRLQNLFAFIIEDILGKTLNLTGRTEIWDLSYILIARSPIIGYGVVKEEGVIYWQNKYFYAHNGLLEVLLEGGVVAAIPFIALFVMAAVVLYRHNEHYISGIITVALFSFLVFFLTEAMIHNIWLFGLLVMAYHVPYVIEQVDHVNGAQRTASHPRQALVATEQH